jgi:hypothetical protein
MPRLRNIVAGLAAWALVVAAGLRKKAHADRSISLHRVRVRCSLTAEEWRV